MNTREMVDSGVNWIENIPKDWKISRFSTIGKPLKNINKDFKEKNRLALTMKGVVRRPLDDNHGLQTNDYSGYQIFEKNDWVFKLIDLQNIKTSRVGLVPERGIMSPAYIRVSSNKTSNEKFVYYTLYSAYLFNIFNDMGGGVRQTVGKEELMDFLLPFPRISEQQSIANFLDHHVNIIDREASLIDKKIELLGEKRKALIFECVTGKRTVVQRSSLTDSQNVVGHGDLVAVTTDLEKMMDSGVEWIGDIPKEWEINRLSNLFLSWKRGITPTYDEESEFHILNQACLSKYKINTLKSKKCVPLSGLRGNFIPGDILLASTGGGIMGKCAFSSQFGYVDTHITIMKPRKESLTLSKVIFYWMSTHFEWMQQFGKGSTNQIEFQIHPFMETLFPISSLQEQQNILLFVDHETSLIDQEISLLKQKQDLLVEKRKALIFEAVTGKIDCRSWAL